MELINFPKRKPMPCPFGGGNDANITPIEMVSSQNVNFYDGFPSVYGAPSANNGKFVTRKEMNAIGNLASNDLFYHKCGGLNTFDPEFALKIGGYAQGAVLQMLFGNDIVNVVSLVDNNMVDFTGMATQEQIQAGILPGSIDGVNWRRCNADYSVRETVLFSMPTTIVGNMIATTSATATVRSITSLRATVTGIVTMEGEWDTSIGLNNNNPVQNCVIGVRSSDTPTFSGPYTPFFNLGPLGTLDPVYTKNQFNSMSLSTVSVVSGKYYDFAFYSVWYQNGNMPTPLYSNVNLKAVVRP